MNSYIEKVCTFVAVFLLSAVFSPSVSAADISTPEEFVAAITGDPTGTHKLTADIALTSWTPCVFSGTLDGAKHKITGLTGSLFSSLTGTVKNLTLQGDATEITIPDMAAAGGFGILAADATGATISGCSVSGFRIVSQQTTTSVYPGFGFFVGRAYDGCQFSCCTVDGSCSVDLGKNVFCGGVVGRAERSSSCAVTDIATFDGCVNAASASSSVAVSSVGNGAFGGILGIFAKTGADVANVKISQCKNSGSLVLGGGDTSTAHTFGGIVGKYEGSSAANSGNLLQIVGCENSGGYSKASGSSKNASFGGMIGYCGQYAAGIVLERCINAGNVVATGSTATTGCCFGGLIGYLNTPSKNHTMRILNSVNRGSITMTGACNGAAGAVGYIKFVSTTSGAGVDIRIMNCSFEGEFSGVTAKGLIAVAGSKSRAGTVFNVDNCWVAEDSDRLLNYATNVPGYAETNLQIHVAGGDATECAALNAVASGVAEYLAWKVSSVTTHPEPSMPHLVRFVDWDDSLLKSELVSDGAAATAPDDPTRAGYTFGGWDPSDFTHVVADMTIRAFYKCTVTFKNWDLTVYQTELVREGTPVAEPQTHPARQNYTFQYWALNDVQYDFSKPVLSELTLIAVFTINTYPVTFLDWNDVQIGDVQMVPHGGSAVAPPLPPLPEGMAFKKWEPAFNNVTGPLTVRAIVASVLSAVWVSEDGVDVEGRGSKTSPFKTVAYAVSSLDQETGGTVYITPGLYPQTKQTRLDAPIRVLGSTGNPEDVILRNTNGTQSDRLFRLNHANAFVGNLTMLDGAGSADGGDAYNYHNGGGFTIREPGGTVSNCVIRNGFALHFSSRGAGAYMYNGLITHCIFTGNFSTQPAYNASPVAEGVVVHMNGAGARMENTLIYDAVPTPTDDGTSHGPIVAVVKGTMRNCTVVPNTQLFKTTSGDANYSKWNADGGCAIRCATGGLVENCAVAGLKNISGALTPFGGTLANFYNCVGDGSMSIAGTHNCKLSTQEAMFIDPVGKDYRPKALGALVNIALDVPGYGNIVDLAGMKRIVKILDVGCYESQFVPGLVITGKRID